MFNALFSESRREALAVPPVVGLLLMRQTQIPLVCVMLRYVGQTNVDPDLQSFFNVNTPADLQQAELNPGKSAFVSLF